MYFQTYIYIITISGETLQELSACSKEILYKIRMNQKLLIQKLQNLNTNENKCGSMILTSFNEIRSINLLKKRRKKKLPEIEDN